MLDPTRISYYYGKLTDFDLLVFNSHNLQYLQF